MMSGGSSAVDVPVVLVLGGGAEDSNDPVLTENLSVELVCSERTKVLGRFHSPLLDFSPDDQAVGS